MRWKSGGCRISVAHKRGKKLETYTILSAEHSIVQPDMIDVEIARNGHLLKVIRVPKAYEDHLLKAKEMIAHKGSQGVPVAYCFSGEMYYAAPRPVDIKDARGKFCWLAGLRRGSLDRFRFYMALRAVVRKHGMRPSFSGPENLMRLMIIQDKIQGR